MGIFKEWHGKYYFELCYNLIEEMYRGLEITEEEWKYFEDNIPDLFT